jgi:hypothetical protein
VKNLFITDIDFILINLIILRMNNKYILYEGKNKIINTINKLYSGKQISHQGCLFSSLSTTMFMFTILGTMLASCWSFDD